MHTKKILVVDDVLATRQGIVSVLRDVPGVNFINAFENHEEALEEIQNKNYYLAMVDLQLHNFNGIELGRDMRKLKPDLKVVIYTKEASIVIAAEVFRHEYYNLQPRRTASGVTNLTFSTIDNLSTLYPMATGLNGYTLLKNITPQSFQRNLELLERYGNYVDSEILDLLLERLNRHRLTPRELDCSELISTGKSNREIAQQLGISLQAVENLINSLYNKLSILGEPKDPGRRVLLALTMQRWRGLANHSFQENIKSG